MALEEHRRIFGYRPPTASRPPKQPAKRSSCTVTRGSTPYSRYVPKNTFTRAVVCLARVGQSNPPNAAERISLSLAGLGEKKITFAKDGDAKHVDEKLVENFPRLVNGGGYEILRTPDGNSKTLIEVPCPPKGYTVNFMKSALGQAKAYVRPLQQDISLQVEEGKNLHQSPKVKCVNCFEDVPMSEMRTHQSMCGGGPSRCESPVQTQITDFTMASHEQDDTVTNKGKINELQKMFPHIKENELHSAITAAMGDINTAVDILLEKLDEDGCETPQENETVCASVDDDTGNHNFYDDNEDELDAFLAAGSPFNKRSTKNQENTEIASILKKFEKKLTGPVLRVSTDDDNLVSDAFVIYKDPEFDASRPIRVTFCNQPAVDTGGPRREFYEKVFAKLASGDEALKLFEGPPTKLLPAYSSQIVFSSVMKCMGKMIAHSISQCGVGISRLSPVCYWYIVHEDVTKALSYADISDVHDVDAATSLNKIVRVTSEEDVNDLNSDNTFIRILSDIGSTCILSLQNKNELVQCILGHTVINKRKAVFDQLKEGLQTLGVLDLIIKHPEVMAPMLIWTEKSLDSALIKSKLRFPPVAGDHVVKIMMLHFIDECNDLELQRLLCFVTGTSCIASLEYIRVVFDATGGEIFASTCTKCLHLPSDIAHYDDFKNAMRVAIMDSGVSFNTM